MSICFCIEPKIASHQKFQILTAGGYFSCEMILRKCLQYSQVSSCLDRTQPGPDVRSYVEDIR